MSTVEFVRRVTLLIGGGNNNNCRRSIKRPSVALPTDFSPTSSSRWLAVRQRPVSSAPRSSSASLLIGRVALSTWQGRATPRRLTWSRDGRTTNTCVSRTMVVVGHSATKKTHTCITDNGDGWTQRNEQNTHVYNGQW